MRAVSIASLLVLAAVVAVAVVVAAAPAPQSASSITESVDDTAAADFDPADFDELAADADEAASDFDEAVSLVRRQLADEDDGHGEEGFDEDDGHAEEGHDEEGFDERYIDDVHAHAHAPTAVTVSTSTTTVRVQDPLMTDTGRTLALAVPRVHPAAAASPNSFFRGEVFAMYNPHKRTCLSVRPHGLRRRLRLVTERCNMAQRFVHNSRMAFHWRPTGDNNLAHLATYFDGHELCARHELTGTRFYPCDARSTQYSLGATRQNGTFKIRDAGRSSRCMDAEFHHALRMKPCGRFRDQGWTKVHIAFAPMHAVPRPLPLPFPVRPTIPPFTTGPAVPLTRPMVVAA